MLSRSEAESEHAHADEGMARNSNPSTQFWKTTRSMTHENSRFSGCADRVLGATGLWPVQCDNTACTDETPVRTRINSQDTGKAKRHPLITVNVPRSTPGDWEGAVLHVASQVLDVVAAARGAVNVQIQLDQPGVELVSLKNEILRTGRPSRIQVYLLPPVTALARYDDRRV